MSGNGQPAVVLRGVRVHNLLGIDLDIPSLRLTVISGVSGAGKSSLALDTLYAEAHHRYLQSLSPNLRQHLQQVDRPDADTIDNLPPAVAVSQRQMPQGPRVTVGTLTEVVDYLRLLLARAGQFHCPNCGRPVRPSTAADVVDAADSLAPGARVTVAFPSRPRPEESASEWIGRLREEGYVRVQVRGQAVRLEDAEPEAVAGEAPLWVLLDRLEAGKASPKRWRDSVATACAAGGGRMALLTDDAVTPFDERPICPYCDAHYPPPQARLLDFNDPLGACPACGGTGQAPAGRKRRGSEESGTPCPVCHGKRLGPVALSFTLAGQNLAEICSWEGGDLQAWCRALTLPAAERRDAENLLAQIDKRLDGLMRVGLGYLTLDRGAPSLSLGEVLRLRLAAALTADMAGVLYVLDEPATGLHPFEVPTLLNVLRQVRDAGNTIVLVENNLDLVRAADHLIDLGRGAGEEGGRVCYQGPPAGLTASGESVTARYLNGQAAVAVPERRRPTDQGALRVTGVTVRNFKDLAVDFPLGVLCVVTGVSGSGKSTLLQDVLYPALSQHAVAGGGRVDGATDLGDVVFMDRRPLSGSARSNPVTFIKAFDVIREEFAATTEAKVRNLDAGAFSFNQPGGRCESCQGQGAVTVDMQFLPDLSVACPECHGSRYRKEVLGIKVRGRSIAEVLDLTAREAFRFFRAHPAVQRKIKPLLDVGLDYLRLGQATDTLSGGEAQRLKLAGQLAVRRKPRGLFLFDEPAAGLHPADVARLLECFDRLLQTGHSLIVVENQIDVVKCADYVIDLGPGAGRRGGSVIAAGTPEEVAAVPESLTGKCLRAVLPPA